MGPTMPKKEKAQHGALLEYGMRDPQHPDVVRLQELLSEHGFDCDGERGFGPKTRTQVMAFQLTKRIKANGVVGLHTWKALTGRKKPVTKPKVRKKEQE
jgi:peptidoglycan hydrolase-like protein with peptidoglycan-binding domain